jgi:hypothetical protein
VKSKADIMRRIKIIIVFACLAIFPVLAFSQPDPKINGDGSSVGNDPVGPTGSPIDGGLSVLLLLGALYGIKTGMSLRDKEGKSLKG